jgi:hypothetical protein
MQKALKQNRSNFSYFINKSANWSFSPARQRLYLLELIRDFEFYFIANFVQLLFGNSSFKCIFDICCNQLPHFDREAFSVFTFTTSLRTIARV